MRSLTLSFPHTSFCLFRGPLSEREADRVIFLHAASAEGDSVDMAAGFRNKNIAAGGASVRRGAEA